MAKAMNDVRAAIARSGLVAFVADPPATHEDVHDHKMSVKKPNIRTKVKAGVAARLSAIEKHKALVASSVEALSALSLTDSNVKEHSPMTAGESMTGVVKHGTGGTTGEVVPSRVVEEESLDDLDVDEYLYSDGLSAMDRMEE